MSRPLSALLGIRFPIIQAPMAGGFCVPALVAAASKAGALGSFGFAYTEPAAMRDQVAETRRLAADPAIPIGINLFVENAPPPVDAAELARAAAPLAPLFARMGVPIPDRLDGPYAPDLGGQIEAVLAIGPRVATSHFRPFPAEAIADFKHAGIVLGASATTVDEALALEAAGYDYVIAQGAEAGGHRGTYLHPYDEGMIGTFALTRLIAKAVRVPVVAAGGIMDGAGIAAVLALGAAAAQMGTAFLSCTEAATHPLYKAALLGDRRPTAITTAFSGRPARGIRNAFIEEAAANHAVPLPFPAQNKLTGPVRAAAASTQGTAEMMSLWAGQAFRLSRAMTVAQLVETLMREAREASVLIGPALA